MTLRCREGLSSEISDFLTREQQVHEVKKGFPEWSIKQTSFIPAYTLGSRISPYHKQPVSLLRRAVTRGLIPSYQPFGQRVRVCLPEVVAAIASSQTGGQSDE